MSGINIDLGPQQMLNTSNLWLNLILNSYDKFSKWINFIWNKRKGDGSSCNSLEAYVMRTRIGLEKTGNHFFLTDIWGCPTSVEADGANWN